MNPISSAYRDAAAYREDEAIEYCKNATTVTAGVLRNENTARVDRGRVERLNIALVLGTHRASRP
jgi:hypothetical protein